MAIKTYKPTTPSRRHMTVSAFEGIDKKAKPERKLTEVLKKNAGRNSYGRITVRHHGGGEGKAPVGRPGPVTPWGKPAMGYKTRSKKNPTNKFIVKRRNEK